VRQAPRCGISQLAARTGIPIDKQAGYEMMQGLRHGAERAVAGDWQALAAILRPLTRDSRAGCRRWAVRELGILHDAKAVDNLTAALADEQPLVRSEACMSLGVLSQTAEPRISQQIQAQLLPVAGHDSTATSASSRNGS
jgi:hypothetical protein